MQRTNSRINFQILTILSDDKKCFCQKADVDCHGFDSLHRYTWAEKNPEIYMSKCCINGEL